MIKKLLFLLSLVICFTVSAQGDMKPILSVETFTNRLRIESKKVNALQSDFVQVKHIANMPDEDVKSSGKFSYKKDSKVMLDYQTPIKYQVVINNSLIKMAANGRESIFDVNANPIMKELQEVLAISMTGNIDALRKNHSIEYFENDTKFLLKIFPKNTLPTTALEEINIYFDKKDLSVISLILIETSKNLKSKDRDYTKYDFFNKKLNVNIPDEFFEIKR
jgi:outer membrane lipoprotein-sorting protein